MSNVFTSMVRVGRDPELKQVGQNDLLAFTAASTTGFGEKKSTLWMACSIWGRQGVALSPYIKKGSQIMVSGELSESKYTAKDGTEKTKLELRVSTVELVGKKDEGGEQRSAYAPSPATRAPAPRSEPQARPETDDDMPF
jgi:single-strand DNA-binding protein